MPAENKEINGFAFLVHPLETKDVSKKYPFAKFIPDFIVNAIIKHLPPLVGSKITGFKLSSGKEVTGWIVICPLTAQQMLDYPELAQKKISQTVHLAQRLGCKLIGLGAFSSIATDGGLYLSDKVKIGLTTGNAYAAALIVENLVGITNKIGVELKNSTLAIVGGAGSVGSACSRVLSSKVKKVILIDNREEELRNLVKEINAINQNIEFYLDLPAPIKADAIITITSSADGIVRSEHLRPGSIVIDGAQPHNVSDDVIDNRNDVLVINSGMARLKNINLHMDVGLKKEEVYACLAEVLILTWQGWKGHYSLGKVNPAHVEELLEFAPKLGLSVVDFRNFKGPIQEADFERLKTFINW